MKIPTVAIKSNQITQSCSNEKEKTKENPKQVETEECKSISHENDTSSKSFVRRITDEDVMLIKDYLKKIEKEREEAKIAHQTRLTSKYSKLKKVQKMLIEKYKISIPDANDASRCLLAGISRGYVKIDETLGLDTILTKGTCVLCDGEISCTIRDALLQPDWGMIDSDDNFADAACKCKNKGCGDFGHYVTGMCENRTRVLESGLYHSHCDECRGFGKCFGAGTCPKHAEFDDDDLWW